MVWLLDIFCIIERLLCELFIGIDVLVETKKANLSASQNASGLVAVIKTSSAEQGVKIASME